MTHPILHAVAAPFTVMGSALVLLTSATARIGAAERLTRLSDAELAARGTTRDEAIRRIVGLKPA